MYLQRGPPKSKGYWSYKKIGNKEVYILKVPV